MYAIINGNESILLNVLAGGNVYAERGAVIDISSKVIINF